MKRLLLIALLGGSAFAQVQLGRNVAVGSASSTPGATLPTNAVVYGTSPSTSRAATATDLGNLLQSSTGCTDVGKVYSPQSNTCIVSGSAPAGPTNALQVNAGSGLFGNSGCTAISGAITCPGTGGSGFLGLGQGASHSTVANTIGFQAPTSVTAYNLTWPSAQFSGCLSNDGAGNLSGVGCGLAGQTINYLPKANSATTSTGPSIVSDDGSTATVHGGLNFLRGAMNLGTAFPWGTNQFTVGLNCVGQGLNAGYGTSSLTGWSGCTMHPETMTVTQPGIAQVRSGFTQSARVGDFAWEYFYHRSFAGQKEASGEGVNGIAQDIEQDGWTSGLVSTGAGTGPTSITTSSTACNGSGGASGPCGPGHNGNYFAVGGLLLDAQAASYTLSLTGCAAPAGSPPVPCVGGGASTDGVNAFYYTTTGASLPASTAWGTLVASSCTVPSAWNSGHTYGQYEMASSGGAYWTSKVAGNLNHTPPGQNAPDDAYWTGLGKTTPGLTTCNVTLGSGSADFSTSTHANLAGQFDEEVIITAAPASSAGVQSITFKSIYLWDGSNNAAIMQGGIGGQALVQAGTLHNPVQTTDWPTAWRVLGVRSNRVYIAACAGGICNGNVQGVTAPQSNLFDHSDLSRSGNVVSVTNWSTETAGTRLPLVPVGSTIVVTGASDSSFNGTFTVASNSLDPLNPAITWNQTAANATATGASVSQGPVGVAIYPAAAILTTQVSAPDADGNVTAVQGTAILAPNTMTVANGDLVVGAPSNNPDIVGAKERVSIHAAGANGASSVHEVEDLGPFPLPWVFRIRNNQPGSTIPGNRALYIDGTYTHPIYADYRPAYGNCFLCIGGQDPIPGVSNAPYYLARDLSSGLGIAFYGATSTMKLLGTHVQVNGSDVCTLSSGCPVGGGTANYYARFNGGVGVTDGLIHDDGVNNITLASTGAVSYTGLHNSNTSNGGDDMVWYNRTTNWNFMYDGTKNYSVFAWKASSGSAGVFGLNWGVPLCWANNPQDNDCTAGFSYVSPGKLALGNGTTPGDTSGELDLATIKATNAQITSLTDARCVTVTAGVLTSAPADCNQAVQYSNVNWSIQPAMFATGTMLGPVYTTTYANGVPNIIVRLSGPITCSVAPVVNLMDLGTSPSTAYGSATSILSQSTGTSAGVFGLTTGGTSMTSGHFYGIAFSSGTCTTAPTIDISVRSIW